MNTRAGWSRILNMAGGICMLVGAIDPMEGSLLILPGSGLVALGTLVGRGERRLIAYRVWVFILIAIGVGAMWGLSAVGGIGGTSGRSVWWGALILPYPIGWSMGVWGPESPRWMLWLGIVAGLWYVTLCVIILASSVAQPSIGSNLPAIGIAAVGLLTIGGCLSRLGKRRSG